MRPVTRLLAAALLLSINAVTVAQSKDNTQARATELVKGFQFRGGIINFVEGDVRCICQGGPDAPHRRVLTAGDTLKVAAGRAEILLNPGYYLRLSANTEARLLDLSPDNLKVKLSSGSAIIEIAMNSSPSPYQDIIDRIFNIVTVITPRDEYAVSRAGAYRFDVVSDKESRVRVLKGRAVVAGTILGDGKGASVIEGKPTLEHENSTLVDSFDTWSRERALSLVRSNKSLKQLDWYKKMSADRAYIEASDDASANPSMARTVSARTGVVAFIDQGEVLKRGTSDWQELRTGGELSNGDRVRTRVDSRAEINPYPDFYLFMRGNSEILFAEPEDGRISVTVLRGSVVVAVTETYLRVKERNTLNLIAANARYEITRKGYYRVNALEAGNSEMLIYDGLVRSDGVEISARKRLVAGGSTIAQFALEKENWDSFDVWSGSRTARSEPIPRRGRWLVRIALAGAWFLNPSTNEYTFVPGERYCKSPYGGDYSAMYRINRPRVLRETTREPINSVRATSPNPF
ncbi:MAG TPA: hypothetical protein DC054_19885 [Blastocatellia bacterium]|nr:hypothetical protein [Blastocatellia bacterium]